jgi:hypothetical protein
MSDVELFKRILDSWTFDIDDRDYGPQQHLNGHIQAIHKIQGTIADARNLIALADAGHQKILAAQHSKIKAAQYDCHHWSTRRHLGDAGRGDQDFDECLHCGFQAPTIIPGKRTKP